MRSTFDKERDVHGSSSLSSLLCLAATDPSRRVHTEVVEPPPAVDPYLLA
jgi:hypothetical protein